MDDKMLLRELKELVDSVICSTEKMLSEYESDKSAKSKAPDEKRKVKVGDSFRNIFGDMLVDKVTDKAFHVSCASDGQRRSWYRLEDASSFLWDEKKAEWPQLGDDYFYPDFFELSCVENFIWDGDEEDLALKRMGICFRTEEEAQKAAKRMLDALK